MTQVALDPRMAALAPSLTDGNAAAPVPAGEAGFAAILAALAQAGRDQPQPSAELNDMLALLDALAAREGVSPSVPSQAGERGFLGTNEANPAATIEAARSLASIFNEFGLFGKAVAEAGGTEAAPIAAALVAEEKLVARAPAGWASAPPTPSAAAAVKVPPVHLGPIRPLPASPSPKPSTLREDAARSDRPQPARRASGPEVDPFPPTGSAAGQLAVAPAPMVPHPSSVDMPPNPGTELGRDAAPSVSIGQGMVAPPTASADPREAPVAPRSEASPPAPASTAKGETQLAKAAPLSRPRWPSPSGANLVPRVSLAIAEHGASLVARLEGLSREERLRLRAQAEALLAAYGLAPGEIRINGAIDGRRVA